MADTGESNGRTDPSPSDVGTAVTGMGVTLSSSPDGSAPMFLPPEEDLSGRVFADRYRIERKIGAGGMGHVYLAEHTTIGKSVAVKVLSAAYRSRKDIVTRFLGEARAASALRHEHVVDITDFGTTPDGAVFFVMEFLEGQPLDELLATEGPLPWGRAKSFMLQILDALGAAHEKGIVHRDMKPDNCFVVPRSGGREHIKVLDFGIAKIMGGEGSEGLTETGAIMGTANYMSPEQAHGDKLDTRTDIYSCGVLLYQMLAGRRPFEANNPMSVMYKHLHAEVPPLLEVNPNCGAPGEAEYVLLRALDKDRELRFQTAEEFAEALRSVPDAGGVPLSRADMSAGGGSTGAVVGTVDDGGSRSSRGRVWAVGGIVAVAVAAVALGVWAGRASSSNDAAPIEASPGVAQAEVSPRADAPKPDDADGPSDMGEAAAAVGAEPAAASIKTGAESPDEARQGPDAETEVAEAIAPTDTEAEAASPSKSTKKRPAARGRTARSVRRAIDKQAKRDVTTCMKRGGAFPGEAVTARVTVDPGGKVSAVKLGRKHAGTPMGKCIEGVLRDAKTGSGDGSATVNLSYTL